MKKLITILVCLQYAIFSLTAQSNKLHHKSIVIDTHNDFLSEAVDKGFLFDTDLRSQKTHSDLQRMNEGGVDAQFFSVWCDGQKENPFQWANREIDSLYAVLGRNPDEMMLVTDITGLKHAIRQKKLAALIGVEGGHMIENDLNKLQHLYDRGTRYMTLTWNNSTDWASSAMDETQNPDAKQKGLSDFGKSVVKKMNELGMIVDVSHVGEKTFWDVMEITTRPVMASHSCAHTLCPVFRNLKDDQLLAIKKNNGVICLNFYSGFVDSSFERRAADIRKKFRKERDSLEKINPEPYYVESVLSKKYESDYQVLRPPLSLLLDHLDHIVKVAGIDHVGLGSDFDGISSSPKELNDVTDFPEITKAMQERGYSKKDIRKVLGGNVMRVLGANTK